MVQSLGGSVKVVNVAIKQETEHAKILGISTIPCLRLYGNNNLKSATYKTYESTNVSADEIAHWILRSQNRTVQSLSGTQDAFREVHSRGSPVGPVVDVSVHEGSPRAALIVRLSKNIEQLPSRFTLFKIKYVGSSEREEFRVYRKKLPFDVGEEEYLTLEEPQWEPKSMLALMLEAESRKVYYGDKPSGVLLGKRALLSVYVSRFESLQDIALLLMEFHEAYNDRIAFHITRSSLKEAARSQDTFSHSWGGAVLTDQQANASAYRRVAGVVRELSPFSQYSLSMPFNYHSLKLFLEEWSTGNPELHFRSNHLTYTKKESSVLELNHHQFLDVLNRAKRAPFAVLYYEPNCADCQAYL
ncbi:LOW QUALITY PROTEIN: protein disulfide isomerase, putative, partial [Eimeria mitis]